MADIDERITDWAPIVGRWNVSADQLIYDQPDKGQRPFGLCISNERFSEGEASVNVRSEQGAPNCRLVLGYHSQDKDYYLVGLGGNGSAYSVYRFDAATGWRPLVLVGREDNLQANYDYSLVVRVKGQRIELYVNSVRVLAHILPEPLPYGQLGVFAWGESKQYFKEICINAEKGQVFVVMQFSGYEELYADVIKPITESFGLKPYRADEVYGPGNILSDIVTGLETAKIVIAEVTPANENVFYEVGYAHALRKPTILLADRSKRLPFDLAVHRCLFYDNSIGGKKNIENGLKKYLQAILDG